MCGIAGIIGADAELVRKALAAMTLAQAHRGPNDSGENILPFGQRLLGLGHRRLSIIDLSCAGHQPMVHPETGNQIVFNGEIYNFQLMRQDLLSAGDKFAGHSDTEAMLHAMTRWGPDYVKRLQGMFAFVFYDAKAQTILLARDSMGIKPLYVARENGMLLFASEVRGILASGLVSRALDRQGVASLLAYGAVQQPATLFGSIKSFPPGHYQLIDSAHFENAPLPKPYWLPPAPRRDMGETEAVAAVEATLDAAVRDHLVADVPVGVFLSSGLDSTVIAGLAARHTRHLRSFCVGFSDQPDLSELVLAKETAKIFGLDHTEITVNGSDAEQAALEWLAALDQPSVDGLNVFIISKAVHQQGITVALSGQGGDELFGGYPSFTDVPKLKRAMDYLGHLPLPLRSAFASMATFRKSKAVRQKFHDMLATSGSLLELYLQRRRMMSDEQLEALGLDRNQLGMLPGWLPPGALDDFELNGDSTWCISALESRFYQGNMLLRDSDTNAMAHALEIRVPMLDQRMLDLMFSVPSKVRLPHKRADKHLLRVAFAPLIRPVLARQAKRGFTLPIRRWMLGPLRDLCEHSLISLKRLGILQPEGVDLVWKTFLENPESPIWTRAFNLCVLGLYVRQMNVT
ncbi:MAG TPA: asparagine synthase (glutamine-hydrolyzing) [Tepidisphaeraceae bacterium]|jgi:asparagine synthase (glutamine-hydrolysing)